LRLMQSRLDESVADLSESLRLRPGYLKARSNLGVALIKQGKLAEGTRQFLQVAQAAPDDPQAHSNLGMALLELGQPAKAETCLAESVRLAPADLAARYELAVAIAKQKRLGEAICHARTLLEMAAAKGENDMAVKAEKLVEMCNNGTVAQSSF